MREPRVATALAAVALCLSMTACSRSDGARPAQALAPIRGLPMATAAMSGAEKLRRLDIMLMVGGLRCRKTPDNFTADYGRFAARQQRTLNAANAQLTSQLAAIYGPAGGPRAFERMSTGMANSYGQGHPWLDCRALKQVTRNLAEVEGRATLEEAADQLLTRRGSIELAYGRR